MQIVIDIPDEMYDSIKLGMRHTDDVAFVMEQIENSTLEQQPCDDCISREDALQALCKAVHKNDDTIPCPNQRVSCLWDKTKVQDYAEEILKLPSVTPQPKQ